MSIPRTEHLIGELVLHNNQRTERKLPRIEPGHLASVVTSTVKLSTIWLITVLFFGNYSFATTYTVGPGSSFTTGTQIYQLIQNLDVAHPVACGDTILFNSGTYTVANGNLFRLQLAGINCPSNAPLTLQAADSRALSITGTTYQPTLDYTATDLNSGVTQCSAIPGSNTASDCDRGAWQITYNGSTPTSYIVIQGLHFKGVHSSNSGNASAIRLTGCVQVGNGCSNTSLINQHITMRYNTFEQNENGLCCGFGSNATIEYSQFLGNGNGDGTAHQIYWGDGDNLIIRYNYFNGYSCCINPNGTWSGGASYGTLATVNVSGATVTLVSGTHSFESGYAGLSSIVNNTTGCTVASVTDSSHLTLSGTGCTSFSLTGVPFRAYGAGGGQNLHNRAWHAWIYGNWFENAPSYEADSDFPDSSLDPGDHVMHSYYFGNVFVPNPFMAGGSYGINKVFTFLDDNLGFTGTYNWEFQWNTVYIRTPSVGSIITNSVNTNGFVVGMFQIKNDTGYGISVAAKNTILHFNAPDNSHLSNWFVTTSGTPTTASSTTGDHNWFDNNATQSALDGRSGNCSSTGTQSFYTGLFTCLVTNTTFGSQSSPPFSTAGIYTDTTTWNVKPTSSGSFGSADTTVSISLAVPDSGIVRPDIVQYTPMTFQTLSSWTDIGAAQYQSPNGSIQTPNTIRTAGTVIQ